MTEIKTGGYSGKLGELFDPSKTVIVTDENVDKLYFKNRSEYRKVVLPAGEKNKTLKYIERIYREFLKFEVDRDYTIIGIGGGVVCDMTGFSAVTYLRGLRFGFFPTTLLAQTDAAIGGKNGIDLLGYKNIIGTFKEPWFIYNDPVFLETLSGEEYLNGISEILKYGFIADREFLKLVVDNRSKVLERDESLIASIIERSAEIKLKIVEKDMTEKNVRRVLNFGHTFGHAFEKLTGVSHGKAVSAGMVAAADLSVNEGFLKQAASDYVRECVAMFGLPSSFNVRSAEVMDAIGKDKKRSGSGVHFIFLEELGKVLIKKVGLKKLGEYVDAVCKSG